MTRPEDPFADAFSALGLKDPAPERVLFWTGAGVSFAPPTCSPSGNELVECALTHYFESDFLSRLRTYYAALGVERSHPRLETVLDVVRRIHGLDALEAALRNLKEARPNTLHRFFAAHVSRGGSHITANFDTCIEACGASGILHFHGSFIDGVDALGATLARIQRGFPDDIATRLAKALTAAETTLVVFAGYSGSDIFDVQPFLRRLPTGSLTGKSVVWVRHESGTEADPKIERHFELLERAGAACVELGCDTTVALAGLAKAWALPAPSPGAYARPSWSAPAVSEASRWRATFELWATMGVHREVARLLESRPAQTADELALAAHTSWSQGRYRHAAEQWKQAFDGPDPISRARAAERAGSSLWVQGRLLHAWWSLRRGLETARAEGVAGEPRWLLAEALGHVLVHMRRRPLLRHFVTETRKQLVLRELPDAPTDGFPSLGVHLDARFGTLRVDLGGPDRERIAPVLSFDEAEALKAMLSYRHSALRRRAEAGDVPAPKEYRRQRDQCLALNAFEAALRVYGIPGAGRAFTFAELRRDLHGVQLAGWAKLLLVLCFIRERLRASGEPLGRATRPSAA